MKLRWVASKSVGQSGFVQSRLYDTFYWEDDHTEIAEVQYHAPVYYVEFVGKYHRMNPGQRQEFSTLQEAQAWATTVYRFHQAENV